MAIPPSAALDILESEPGECDGDGHTCSNPDHEETETSLEDWSTGDYAGLSHEMYCHNCGAAWTNYIEYRS